MFQVNQMRATDFSFATRLANTMNWNMAKEDFKFMSSLEPEGCFVAFDGSKRSGIATCISYGEVGWFGNLIVKETHREKGVGSLLVDNAVKYLQGIGVKTIGLYAYPNLVGFYAKFGFKYAGGFSVLHADSFGSVTAQSFPKVSAGQFQEIVEFDRCCFGGDRRRLLASIIKEEGNLSYFAVDGKQIVGYAAATVYKKLKIAWVGPSICESTHADFAVSLIEAILEKLSGFSVYTVLPKKETSLMNTLLGLGFKEEFAVSRMFLGPEVAKNYVYVAESLERG